MGWSWPRSMMLYANSTTVCAFGLSRAVSASCSSTIRTNSARSSAVPMAIFRSRA